MLRVSRQHRCLLLVGPCDRHSAPVEAAVEQGFVAVFRSACEGQVYRVPGLVAVVAHQVGHVQLVEVCRWAGEGVLCCEQVRCDQTIHHLVSLAG